MPEGMAGNWWANDPVAGGGSAGGAPAMPSEAQSPAGTMPSITPAGAAPKSGENWWGDDPVAEVKEPVKPAPQVTTQSQETPAKRSLGGQALHTAGVGAAGIGKGLVAASPPGIIANAPSMGMQLGAAIGTLPAYGINLAMGNPSPWESAKATSRGVQEDIGKYIPNTSNTIDAAFPILPQPENKTEEYLNSAAQFASGGKLLGQSVPLSAAAGLASEGAGQLTAGSPFEPVARMGAGIAPFAVGAALSKGPAVKTSNPMNQDENIKVSSRAAQKVLQGVEKQALNPQQASQNVKQGLGENSGQLVEGVKPTLGEVAGDQGIAQAQNTMRQKYPQPFQKLEQQRQTGMAQQLDKNVQLGNREDVGTFVGARLEEANKSAADQLSAVGKYGEQPEKGATGNPILDAQKYRREQTGKLWDGFNKVADEPADAVTLRNAAQDLVNEGGQYGVGGLHPEVKAIVDQILNPPRDALDSVRTLQNFASQISAARNNPNLPRPAGAALGKLQDAINTGLDNTVEGLALDKPDGAPAKLTSQEKQNYFEARKSTARDYTLEGLEQRQVVTPEGRLNTKKLDTWQGNPKNVERLQRQDLQQPINQAAEAQRSVDKLKENPLSATADSNVSPMKVIGQIMNSKTLDAAKQSKAAMEHVIDDPAAVAGLKSAYAQWINENVAHSKLERDINNVESGRVSRGDNLQKFFSNQRKALEQIFSKEELQHVEGVSKEIYRNQEFERMANIKGQSNTNKNAIQSKPGMMRSTYNWLANELTALGPVAGGLIGSHAGPVGAVAGAAGGVALRLINKMKENGIRNREMLELKMYTDPQFFQTMKNQFSGENPNNLAINKIIRSLDDNKLNVGSRVISTQDGGENGS